MSNPYLPVGQQPQYPYAPPTPPPPRSNFLMAEDGRVRPGWRVAIYFTLFLILMLVFQVIATLIYLFTNADALNILTTGELGDPTALLIISAFNLPAALITAYLMWRFVDKRPFPEMGFRLNGGAIALDSLLGLVQGAICMGGIFLLEMALGLVSVQSVALEPVFFLAFVCLLAAAAAEEIATRGYGFHTTVDSWGALRAGALATLIFGIAHGANPNFNLLAFLNILYAGVVFTVQVLATRNLWLPIAFHFAWNFFQGPVFGFPVSGIEFPGLTRLEQTGGMDWLTGGAFGPEGGLASTLALTVILLFTLWQWSNRRKSATL